MFCLNVYGSFQCSKTSILQCYICSFLISSAKICVKQTYSYMLRCQKWEFFSQKKIRHLIIWRLTCLNLFNNYQLSLLVHCKEIIENMNSWLSYFGNHKWMAANTQQVLFLLSSVFVWLLREPDWYVNVAYRLVSVKTKLICIYHISSFILTLLNFYRHATGISS